MLNYPHRYFGAGMLRLNSCFLSFFFLFGLSYMLHWLRRDRLLRWRFPFIQFEIVVVADGRVVASDSMSEGYSWSRKAKSEKLMLECFHIVTVYLFLSIYRKWTNHLNCRYDPVVAGNNKILIQAGTPRACSVYSSFFGSVDSFNPSQWVVLG